MRKTLFILFLFLIGLSVPSLSHAADLGPASLVVVSGSTVNFEADGQNFLTPTGGNTCPSTNMLRGYKLYRGTYSDTSVNVFGGWIFGGTLWSDYASADIFNGSGGSMPDGDYWASMDAGNMSGGCSFTLVDSVYFPFTWSSGTVIPPTPPTPPSGACTEIICADFPADGDTTGASYVPFTGYYNNDISLYQYLVIYITNQNDSSVTLGVSPAGDGFHSYYVPVTLEPNTPYEYYVNLCEDDLGITCTAFTAGLYEFNTGGDIFDIPLPLDEVPSFLACDSILTDLDCYISTAWDYIFYLISFPLNAVFGVNPDGSSKFLSSFFPLNIFLPFKNGILDALDNIGTGDSPFTTAPITIAIFGTTFTILDITTYLDYIPEPLADGFRTLCAMGLVAAFVLHMWSLGTAIMTSSNRNVG